MHNLSLYIPILTTVVSLVLGSFLHAQGPGRAVDFDGADDYLLVNDHSSLDITDAITIEAWVKPTGDAGTYWMYKKQIAVDHTLVDATLDSFPVLISVVDPDLKDTDNSGSVQPDGDDIIFTTMGGMKLNHEIELYDGSSGRLVAWVQIPSLSHTVSTKFYMYYGNAGCSNQQDPAGVWDSNYKMVQHMEETTKTPGSYNDHYDSTTNDNDGEAIDNVTMNYSTGMIDGADDFAGDNYSRVESPDATSLDVTGAITLEGWANVDDFTNDTKVGIVNKYRGYIEGTGPVNQRAYTLLICADGIPGDPIPEEWQRRPGFIISSDGSYDNAKEFAAESVAQLLTGKWYYLAATYKPSTFMRIYLDGDLVQEETTGIPASIDDSPAPLWIGAQSTIASFITDTTIDGKIDEVRVSNTARSNEWIKTCYNAQANQETFLALGSQTAAGISKAGAYGLGISDSKVSAGVNGQILSSEITPDIWYHVALTYDRNSGGTEEMKLYVNGVERDTKDYSGAIDSNDNDLLIGDIVGFNGIIDEIRIWNTARSETDIRTDMCRKLTGSESGLTAYWRLDETSGTGCTDHSANSNTATMTNMNPATDRISSGAPVGNASTYVYTDAWTGVSVNLSHGAGDDITVGSVTATPSGIHIYMVDEEPDVTAPPAGYECLSRARYWGTYIADCTSATYTVTYDYDGHPGIVDESALKLAKRTDGADPTWEDTGAILDIGANTLTGTGETGTEYILGTSSEDNPLPVELVCFSATAEGGGVILSWRTESEVDNLGFNLYRRRTGKSLFSKVNSQIIPGAGSSPEPHEYTFNDGDVEGGYLHFYYLEDVSLRGATHQSEAIQVFVPCESQTAIPDEFALLQNFPNPFNPGTWIPYQLAMKSTVEISIYDVAGHLVRTLSSPAQAAGYYRTERSALYWNGKDEHGCTVPSGIYIYQLRTGNFTEKRKMVVMK